MDKYAMDNRKYYIKAEIVDPIRATPQKVEGSKA